MKCSLCELRKHSEIVNYETVNAVEKWKKSGFEGNSSKKQPKSSRQKDERRTPTRRGKGTDLRDRTASSKTALRASADSYLLWGQHAVEAALANAARDIRHIYTTIEAQDRVLQVIEALPQTRKMTLPTPQIEDRARFDALNSDGSKALHQQLVLDVCPLESPDLTDVLYQDGTLRLLVLDQVTDPRNIGAMLRSARAFGVSAVIMTRRNAPEEGGVLARAAAGALEDVSIIHVTNLARALEMMADYNVHRAGLDAAGDTTLETLADESRLAIIMGSEGDGMRRLTKEACDSLVSIPMSDSSESLNVSVAAAIALYATRLP